MPAAYSEDLRKRALALLDEGWTRKDVARVLNIHPSSLSRWLDLVDKNGNVQRLKPPGRPRKHTRHDLDLIAAHIEQTPDIYLGELAVAVARDNVAITVPTLARRIDSLGLSRKVPQRVPERRDEDERAAFAAVLAAHAEPHQLVYLDETHVDGRDCLRTHVRGPVGERVHQVVDPRLGERYTFMGALTLDGMLAGTVLTGGVGGQQFFSFVVNELVRPARSPLSPVLLLRLVRPLLFLVLVLLLAFLLVLVLVLVVRHLVVRRACGLRRRVARVREEVVVVLVRVRRGLDVEAERGRLLQDAERLLVVAGAVFNDQLGGDVGDEEVEEQGRREGGGIVGGALVVRVGLVEDVVAGAVPITKNVENERGASGAKTARGRAGQLQMRCERRGGRCRTH